MKTPHAVPVLPSGEIQSRLPVKTLMQFKSVCKSWESLLMEDSILPSDLLMEILSWLPVKTLMQFKCISKSWESLITNDQGFAKLHLKRSPKNTHILLTLHEERDIEHMNTCVVPCSMRHLMEEPSSVINEDGCYNLTDKYLKIQEGIYLWKHKYWIVGSCNGLVCLGRFSDVDQIEELWVKLWNPATRLWSKKSPIFRMNLRTEASDSWGKVNCGFGYDDSCDSYKVVVVFWDCTEQKVETMVHCMGDSCWRKILSDPCSQIFLKQIEGQFVGGCVNWLALKNLNSVNYQWENITLQQLLIVSLDMREEVYNYLSLPEGVSEVPHIEPDLGILGNHMCLFHDHSRTHFVVWQMRQYAVQESWTRLISISYEHLQWDNFQFYPRPICLSEEGDILLLSNPDDVEVIKYNLRDNNVEYIELPNNKAWLRANNYIQSLVSPCQVVVHRHSPGSVVCLPGSAN